MGLTCFAILVLYLIKQAVGSPGDPVMYLPPFEVRTVDMNNMAMQFPNSQFILANQRQLPPQQQQILHNTPAPPPPKLPEIDPVTERPHDHHNFTLNEFVDVMNEIAEHNDESHDSDSRAAERDYGSPPFYPPFSSYPSYPSHSRPYGPPRPPAYGSYGPPAYRPHPPVYAPHAPVHTSKTVEPILTGLLKPVTTKVASKVSGLIGLVLTLLTGSAPDDLELKGFKDIVINGIVRPLLIAKGGIKSLISKLTIPVISLLLINLEVLVTIWWLWEECPQPTYSHPTESYSKPAYSYNNNHY